MKTHTHTWDHYFSGWYCTDCGKKSGYDYTNDPKYGKPAA